MNLKQFTSSITVNDNRIPPQPAANDNRIPPQPAAYHCNIEVEFISMNHALSFHEDLVKLIAEYRSPMLVTQSPINVNKEND